METTPELNREYVGANVRELREGLDLDLVDLSAQLETLGVRLGKNALSKLETGGRNITTDELVALAVALGVTPNRILLGDAEDISQQQVCIAHKWTLTLLEAWKWIQGEKLPVDDANDSGVIRTADLRANTEFRRRSTPHEPHESMSIGVHRELVESGIFDGVRDTVDKLEARGLTPDLARQHIELMRVFGNLQDLARPALHEEDQDDAEED